MELEGAGGRYWACMMMRCERDDKEFGRKGNHVKSQEILQCGRVATTPAAPDKSRKKSLHHAAYKETGTVKTGTRRRTNDGKRRTENGEARGARVFSKVAAGKVHENIKKYY